MENQAKDLEEEITYSVCKEKMNSLKYDRLLSDFKVEIMERIYSTN